MNILFKKYKINKVVFIISICLVFIIGIGLYVNYKKHRIENTTINFVQASNLNNEEVFLSWANTDEDYDHLEIYCSTDNFTTNKQGEKLVELPKDTNYYIYKIGEKNITYYYTFYKVNKLGDYSKPRFAQITMMPKMEKVDQIMKLDYGKDKLYLPVYIEDTGEYIYYFTQGVLIGIANEKTNAFLDVKHPHNIYNNIITSIDTSGEDDVKNEYIPFAFYREYYDLNPSELIVKRNKNEIQFIRYYLKENLTEKMTWSVVK